MRTYVMNGAIGTGLCLIAGLLIAPVYSFFFLVLTVVLPSEPFWRPLSESMGNDWGAFFDSFVALPISFLAFFAILFVLARALLYFSKWDVDDKIVALACGFCALLSKLLFLGLGISNIMFGLLYAAVAYVAVSEGLRSKR